MRNLAPAVASLRLILTSNEVVLRIEFQTQPDAHISFRISASAILACCNRLLAEVG